MDRIRPTSARIVTLAAVFSLLALGAFSIPGVPPPARAGRLPAGTHPLDPLDDPDLDGLINLQESILGTDPNNSDSDGEGGREVLPATAQAVQLQGPSFRHLSGASMRQLARSVRRLGGELAWHCASVSSEPAL